MTTAPASWVGLDLENDRYHVTAALGEGGMAHIYRAFDRKKQRDVVLKVPKPALLADPEFVHRFAREVKTLVELKHPSIVAVLGFGRHLGLPFAVLEYMPGGTLDDRNKPCEPTELTEWLVDVGAALDHIHNNGYVHRDVKPSNILFDTHGRARLSDFGVIKSIDERVGQTRALTESGVAVGTPEYMAPELARGEIYDGKVDQYALAVTVYEMLAGRRPIEGGSGPVILVKQIQETPLPLNEVDSAISMPLASAVSRALAKDPRQRFADCSEFAKVICSAINDRPVRATTRNNASVTDQRTDGKKFNSMLLWWIAPTTLSLAILVGALTWFLKPPGDAALLPGNNLIANDQNPPAPVVTNNFSISAAPASAFVGKQNQIVVRVDRIGSWSGPVQVQLVEPPADCNFQQLAATIPAGATECQFPFTPRRTIKDVTLKFLGTAEQSKTVEATANVSVRAATFTIAPLDAIDMAPGESRFVSIFLNREGFDEAVDLIVRLTGGVRSEPTNVHFDAGSNEASIKLNAPSSASKAASAVRLMYNGQEKARFDVRVIATSITPVTPNRPKKTDDGVGQLVTREAGNITGLAFHPKDATTLAIWTDRGWVNLWDLEAKSRKGGQHLSTAGTRGTFSADGRQIVTCGSNLVHLMNSRGETVSQGPSSHRILGVYYDGQFPHFWTASGICNHLGKLVQPTTPGKGVTKIKYATAGATHSVRDFDGKIQWRGGQAIQTWDAQGPIDDFAISHDGRWVTIAAKGKVWIQDTSQADSKPTWSKDIPDVAAVAIAPNGKQLAIGLNNGEVRLVSVESSP